MTDQQYSLNLMSADDSGLPPHSIRTPKNQKIKNLGLLGRRVPGATIVETEWNSRAQQLIARYAEGPRELFTKLAARFAQLESQRPDGAWDWQGWEQRFFQVLWYRRFLAHPLLFNCAEEFLSFPVSWTVAPKNSGPDLLRAIQALRQERCTAGVRLSLGDSPTGTAWEIFSALAPLLDAEITRFPKPYPELQVSISAHHSDLSQFLTIRNADRRQCRRGLAIEFPQALAQSGPIFEPLLREIHQALRDGLEHLVLVFRPGRAPTDLLRRDPLCAGALNLAEFVDSGERRVLADEMVGALATSLRLVQHWRSVGGEDQPRPWLGVIGFADAIDRLELSYDSPEALAMATRLGQRLRREANAACERLPGFQGQTPLIFAAGSRFFSQLGSSVPGFVAENPDAPFQRSLEIQSAFAGPEISLSTAMARKGGQLEVEAFLELVETTARQGWRALRFL